MHTRTTATAAREWGLEAILEQGWNLGHDRHNAASWGFDRGYVTEREPAGESLAIPWEDWDHAAGGPASSDPEESDRWAFDHEALACLLGVGQERMHIEAIGHVGGSHLRLRVVYNESELDLRAPDRREFRTVGGAHVTLSPLAFGVAQRAREFALAATHTRAEQLGLIARLKATQALANAHAAIASRFRLALSPHLESFEVEQPAEFEAKWVADGPSRVTLNLYVKGQNQPLPLDSFDEKGGVVDLDGRRTMLLSPGAAAVAVRAREHQSTRKARVDPSALRSPIALLGDDVDATGVDFSDYALEDFSHRVLGFEPAKREKELVVYSSGTPWYENDGDGAVRFVIGATTPAGDSVSLAIETVEEALQVAARADEASEQPNTPIEVQGQQVIPTPGLGDQLRDLVRLAKPESEVEEPTQEEQPPPAKPKRLRPVIDEVSQQPDPARVAAWDIESAVPWTLLDSVLSPGVALKTHQRTGVAWLWHRYVNGLPGALLADDMGLGKTLQIASFIALAKARPRRAAEPRPTLVVAPVILIANWAEELKHFFIGSPFPGRILALHDDALRRLKDKQGALDRARIQAHDIVITSYESLARYAPSLLGIAWDLVVLDEAHRIKNRGTSWSIAARGLSGLDDPARPRKFDFGICATGTPVENHVMDLWALYDFLSPGSPFGTYADFCRDYERRPDAPIALAARLEVKYLESSLLRRTKDEVLPHELPGKEYRTIAVGMTEHQRAQERVLVSRGQKKGGIFAVLQGLQKLYQHPWLLDDTPEARSRNAEDAIAASPKLAATLKLLQEIRERGEKALVFTLWTEMQYLLRDIIKDKFALPEVRIINGDPKNRARALDSIAKYSDTPGFNVMVLSPLAAGVGLNIVAANHVIHYGRWWNPAKEDQATDRAYRIGQTRKVTVYYPVLHHPGRPDQGFDVKLDELVGRKRSMARELLDPVDGEDVTTEELQTMGVQEQ